MADNNYKIDQGSAERIDKTVRKVLGPGNSTNVGNASGEPSSETLWAVLGNEVSPGFWEWTEIVGDHAGNAGIDSDYGWGTSQRNGDNSRDEPFKNLARTMWDLYFGGADATKAVDSGGWKQGDIVLLRRFPEQISTLNLPDNIGQWRSAWKIVSPPPNSLIYVDLNVTSGDGSAGSPYIYDALIRSGPVVASGQYGSNWSGVVQCNPANWGIAFYGVIAPSSVPERFFQLIWTNETPNMDAILPDGTYSCGTGTITITNGFVSGVS